MYDFFISYTGKDEKYATWIAEILERKGCSVIIQAWDFRPGDNFIKKINYSLKNSRKLLIVLSSEYLKSNWCEEEWVSKLAEQTRNGSRTIIPVRIEPVVPTGLLEPIVYIDIVDKSEADAVTAIYEGISETVERRAKSGFPAYYSVENKEISIGYRVESKQIVYTKKCITEIKTDGKNSIHNRITWFDDETVSILPVGEIRIERIELPDTNINYNVVFDRELKRGEIIEYEVKAILTNKKGHFKDFFSTEVITPIERLNIMIFHIEGDLKSIYTQRISSSLMNTRTEEPIEHEPLIPFSWNIDKPELGFEYKIFWK